MSDTLLDTGDRVVNRYLKFVSSCTFPVNRREWQNAEQVCLGLVHWDGPEGGYGVEEGGRFRIGSTGIPVADSFRHWAKLIQYCKV